MTFVSKSRNLLLDILILYFFYLIINIKIYGVTYMVQMYFASSDSDISEGYIGGFLSQTPTILILLGKTIPDLLELQNVGNSTLICSNSLWHFYTPRFCFRWTMMRWWSQRLREKDLCRPITFELLNGIVCGRCHFSKLCESYHLKYGNLNADSS